MVVRALYTAPDAERSTPGTAVAPFTAGDHPRIIPLSVANRNLAGPDLPLWLTTKAVALPLDTVPVGPPGTATVSATFEPVPLYSVDVSVPLFDTHHGVVGPAERPQPLTTDASAAGAAPAVSPTRLWTVKMSSAIPPVADPAMTTAAAIATTALAIRNARMGVSPFVLERDRS